MGRKINDWGALPLTVLVLLAACHRTCGHAFKDVTGSSATDCDVDEDCSKADSATPFCIGWRCKECRTHEDCRSSSAARGRSFCVVNACEQCRDDADCAATQGRPACVAHTCSECHVDKDCTRDPERPACDGDHCVACNVNADCARSGAGGDGRSHCTGGPSGDPHRCVECDVFTRCAEGDCLDLFAGAEPAEQERLAPLVNRCVSEGQRCKKDDDCKSGELCWTREDSTNSLHQWRCVGRVGRHSAAGEKRPRR